MEQTPNQTENPGVTFITTGHGMELQDLPAPPPASNSHQESSGLPNQLVSASEQTTLDVAVVPPYDPTAPENQDDVLHAPPQQAPSEQPVTVDHTLEDSFSLLAVFTAKFWLYFFDVNSIVVLRRLFNALKLIVSDNYNHISATKPDLYGPFWIATSAIFFFGFFANLTSFISSLFRSQDRQDVYHSFDWNLVPICAGGVYGFMLLVPLLVSLFLFFYKRSNGAQAYPNISSTPPLIWWRLYLTILCIYGYSLLPLLCAVVFTVIPFTPFRMIILGIGLLYSFINTIINLKPLCDVYLPPQSLSIAFGILFFFHLILYIPFPFCFVL